MSLVLGLDLGTTTLTALVLDVSGSNVLVSRTVANQADITSAADRARGRSEWDIRAIADRACDCLRALAETLAGRTGELAGLGLTGQQHGVVVVGPGLEPRTPFINWQDRRGEETVPGTTQTFTERARELAGDAAPRRTGCRLATGYLAVTLFWLKENGILPADGPACFVGDYFAALLTGQQPVTDATFAASSGVFDVAAGEWAWDLITALGLPVSLFPEVRPSGSRLGVLTAEMAARTGLPAGLPTFVGIGDNQASFLGSVADCENTLLVNVGTGGQVAAFTDTFAVDPALETRPFPGGGYLLVNAGLSGGRIYALLEGFFRAVATEVCGLAPAESLYAKMNRLAAAVLAGAGGLRCEPFFSGTRQEPGLRASLTGLSAENFSPGHLTRALLEGMARTFRSGAEAIERHLPPHKPQAPARGRRLVGAGNGLRENPLLARLVAEELGLPLSVPQHREEAAFGAALLAAVGAGLVPDLRSAARLLRYTHPGGSE
jgi:sugar (pentulose or hexulose) kinase